MNIAIFFQRRIGPAIDRIGKLLGRFVELFRSKLLLAFVERFLRNFLVRAQTDRFFERFPNIFRREGVPNRRIFRFFVLSD